MSVHVREARADDLAAVAAFGAAVVPPHYTPILGERAAAAQLSWWTPAAMAAAVEADRVHLAVVGDEVVGVCQTGEHAGEQVIWKLYLAAAHRGRALGVRLLEHAVAALPRGTARVDVEHFAGNVAAGRFYAREGFAVLRTEPAPRGEPPAAAVVWRRRSL